jgi:hypothetical protein
MGAYEDGYCTDLNQLDARNLLAVFVPQKSEEQLLYDPVKELAISNQRSNAACPYFSPG